MATAVEITWPKVQQEQTATERANIEAIRKLLPQGLPLQMSYKSNDMNEGQNTMFLIRESDKVLFPNGERLFSHIVTDDFNKDRGAKNNLEIIRKYINWIDIDGAY